MKRVSSDGIAKKLKWIIESISSMTLNETERGGLGEGL